MITPDSESAKAVELVVAVIRAIDELHPDWFDGLTDFHYAQLEDAAVKAVRRILNRPP